MAADLLTLGKRIKAEREARRGHAQKAQQGVHSGLLPGSRRYGLRALSAAALSTW